jgi:hypothetical protein
LSFVETIPNRVFEESQETIPKLSFKANHSKAEFSRKPFQSYGFEGKHSKAEFRRKTSENIWGIPKERYLVLENGRKSSQIPEYTSRQCTV